MVDTSREGARLGIMRTEGIINHITDDLGNDVVTRGEADPEYAALCAVADAAEEGHRAHCLLLTSNCAICQALAELDIVRQNQHRLAHN